MDAEWEDGDQASGAIAERIARLDPAARRIIENLRRPVGPDDPRRHHFIPQHFQKRFAEGDFIARVSLLDPAVRPVVNVNGVAVIKDFYTVVEEDIGETVDVEGLLAIIDGDAVGPLARLAMGVLFPPQPLDRDKLALWFSSLYFRGPAWRRRSELMVDLRMKAEYSLLENDANARAHLRDRNGGEEPSQEDLDELRAAISSLADVEICMHQNQHIQQMLFMMNDAVSFFGDRYWVLVKFKKPGLFLSDRPIITYIRPENRSGFAGHGLANADELWMPLDRKTALIMHSEPLVGNRVVQDMHGVQNFNQTLLMSGVKEIYCHPDDAWQLDELEIPDVDRPLMAGGSGPLPSWVADSTDGFNRPPTRRTHRRYRRDEEWRIR